MAQHDYTVQLEAFQGPMDLLLYLIRRNEVDITDIPVARITDQYMAMIRHLDRVDIELAGEFLVMAATLMEIKSRMITPLEGGGNGAAGERTEGSADDELAGLDQADPRYELVKQLLAYKRFRDAADSLENRWQDWLARFPAAKASLPKARTPDVAEAEPMETDLEDIGVYDLFEIFERIIAAVDFGRMGDHHVAHDDTPIIIHQEDLLDQLRRAPEKRISLRQAVQGRPRSELVGMFLAILELVRERKVNVRQDRLNDDLFIEPVEDGEATPIPEPAASSEGSERPAAVQEPPVDEDDDDEWP